MRHVRIARAAARATRAFVIISLVAKLLLNLRNVPDDEAEEVRAWLREHGIEHYETRPSPWGISAGGIWIRHDKDAAHAARLMEEYQRGRRARARAEHEAAKRQGTAATVWSTAREDPLRFLAVLALIVLLLALVSLPFALLGR